MNRVEDHPLADVFPLLPDGELSSLAADIKANGLHEHITLLDGKILDGRNRYRACQLAGVDPGVFVRYTGADPLAFVISKNLHRRHLSESQRAMVAARLANTTHGGDRRSDQAAKLPVEISQPTAAKLLNVSERSLRDAKAIQKASPKLAKQVEAGEKTVTAARRELKIAEVKDSPALPSGKFRVLYADPPWKYSDQLTESYGPTKFHYPAMSSDELCAMPIRDVADKDAVLFLWVTSPMLETSFDVINAWGFTYKTSFVWDKIKHNMGHYNSVRHELLLVCTRGSCTPDNPKLFDSVQSIERSKKHSEKPREFRKIIETLYPKGRRLELFAREPVKGWEVYGNQC